MLAAASSSISAGSRRYTGKPLFETLCYSTNTMDTIDPGILAHDQSILTAAPIQDATPVERSSSKMGDEDTESRHEDAESCHEEDFNIQDWVEEDYDMQDWCEEDMATSPGLP